MSLKMFADLLKNATVLLKRHFELVVGVTRTLRGKELPEQGCLVCHRTCRKILGKALSESQVLVTGGVLDKARNVFGNEEQLPSLLDTKCRYLNSIRMRCLKCIGHYKVAWIWCSG